MTDASKTYTRRQHVLYREVIESRSGRRPEDVVDEYAKAHPEADLEQRLTFAEWRAEETGQSRRAGARPAVAGS